MASLEQVAEAIKSKEKQRDFRKVYKHFNFQDNSPFSEYIQFIYENQTKWMDESLPKWKSEITIEKQYQALFDLFDATKYPEISPLVDEDIQKTLRANLPKIVQDLIKQDKPRFTPRPLNKSKKNAKVAPQEADSDTEEEYEEQSVQEDATPQTMEAENTQEPVNVQELLAELKHHKDESKYLKQDNDRFASILLKRNKQDEINLALRQLLVDYTKVMDNKEKALEVVHNFVLTFKPL